MSGSFGFWSGWNESRMASCFPIQLCWLHCWSKCTRRGRPCDMNLAGTVKSKGGVSAVGGGRGAGGCCNLGFFRGGARLTPKERATACNHM